MAFITSPPPPPPPDIKQEPETKPSLPVKVPAPAQVVPPPPVSAVTTSSLLVAYSTPLHCDICNISVNRPDQLENHKRGTKHLKKMNLHGLVQSKSGKLLFLLTISC